MTVFVEFDIKKPLGLETGWLKACRNLKKQCGRFWWYFFSYVLTWSYVGWWIVQKRTISRKRCLSNCNWPRVEIMSCTVELSCQALNCKNINPFNNACELCNDTKYFRSKYFLWRNQHSYWPRNPSLLSRYKVASCSRVTSWRLYIIHSQHL